MTLRAIARFLIAASVCACLAHGQGIVDQIRSRGKLVISTDATYPPFETKKDDKIVGFDADIGAELAKELGVKVEWIDQEWAGVLGSLESGKADLVMAGVTITEERKKSGYLFSRPYFLSGQVIAKRKGDDSIQKPTDLLGKMVSVQQQTTGQFAVDKIGVPKDHQLRFDQIQDGLLDVQNKKSDACVGDLPTIKFFLQTGYPGIELTGPPFVKENLGIVAWKTHPELIAQVNLAIEKMLVDGRYAAIFQKWFGEPLTTSIVADLDKGKSDGSPVPPVSEKPSGAIPAATANAPRNSFDFRWDILGKAIPHLIDGAKLTVILTLLSLCFGVVGGLILALARVSPVTLFRPIAMAYVEVVRGTPLLMQIYVIYFVLPTVGISLSSFVSGVLALSLNAAAYTSEIFRAGIESIEDGQMEAARSLGMDYRGAMRWVILPQTLRRVLPPLTNEAVALLKDSSLVSVVALSELMREGKQFATDNGSPTTIYLSVAAFYLLMTLPLTWLVRRLEVRLQPISRPRAKKVKP